MAHGLDLLTIAEGVETSEQGSLLTQLQCDMVQGFHYCEPVPAEEFQRKAFKTAPSLKISSSG